MHQIVLYKVMHFSRLFLVSVNRPVSRFSIHTFNRITSSIVETKQIPFSKYCATDQCTKLSTYMPIKRLPNIGCVK